MKISLHDLQKDNTNFFSTYDSECFKYGFVKGNQLENAKETKVFLKILGKIPKGNKVLA